LFSEKIKKLISPVLRSQNTSIVTKFSQITFYLFQQLRDDVSFHFWWAATTTNLPQMRCTTEIIIITTKGHL